MANDKIKPKGKTKGRLEPKGDSPRDRLTRDVLEKASKRSKLRSTSTSPTKSKTNMKQSNPSGGKFTKGRTTRNSTGGWGTWDGDNGGSQRKQTPRVRVTRASSSGASTPTVVKVEPASSDDDEDAGQIPTRVTRRSSLNSTSAIPGPSSPPKPRIVKRATRLLFAKPKPLIEPPSQDSTPATTDPAEVNLNFDELTISIPELSLEELWNLLHPENSIPLRSRHKEARVKTISSSSTTSAEDSDSISKIPANSPSSNQNFSCSQCSSKFPLRRGLQIHMKNKHADSEQKSTATDASADHVVLDTPADKPDVKSGNEIDLPCFVCSRSFQSKKALSCHLWHKHKVKSAKQPQNEVVDKISETAAQTPKIQFRCQKCPRSFPLRKGLLAHIKREHCFLGTTPTSTRKHPEASGHSAKVKTAKPSTIPNRILKLCIRRLTSKQIQSFRKESKGMVTPEKTPEIHPIKEEKKILKLCLRRLSETEEWVSFNQRRSKKRERSPSSDGESERSSKKPKDKKKKSGVRSPTPEVSVDEKELSDESEEDSPLVSQESKKKKTLSKSKQFTCNFCGHVTNSFKNLESHIFTHTGERPHACSSDDCTADFISEEERLDHEKEFHPELFEYQCVPCHLGFESKEEFTSHNEAIQHSNEEDEDDEMVENVQRSPSPEPPLPPPTPEPESQDELEPELPVAPENHAKVEVAKPKQMSLSPSLTCPKCPRSFQLNIALQTHIRQMHSTNEPVTEVVEADIPCIRILEREPTPEPEPIVQSSFICSVCPQKHFSLRRNLLMHIRKKHKHRADFLIGEFLEKERELNPPQHQLVHPFRCTKCPKSFQLRKGLQVHTWLVHKEGGPAAAGQGQSKTKEFEHPRNMAHRLICPQPNCDAHFNYRRSLHEHLDKVHGITCTNCSTICSRPKETSGPEIQFRCPQCPLSFSFQHLLREHLIEKHTRVEKEKKSVIVPRAASNALANSSDISKQYICSRCSVRFSTSQELAKHLESHAKILVHGNGAHARIFGYSCSQCSERFTTHESLFAHNMIHAKNSERERIALTTAELVPPSICGQCGQGFEKPEELALHQLNHSRGAVATYQYAKEGSTHRHLFTVHDEQGQLGSFNPQVQGNPQQPQPHPIQIQNPELQQSRLTMRVIPTGQGQGQRQPYRNSYNQQRNEQETVHDPSIRIVEAYSLATAASKKQTSVSIPTPVINRPQVIVQVAGRAPPLPSQVKVTPIIEGHGQGQVGRTENPESGTGTGGGGSAIFACKYCPMTFFTQKFLDYHAAIHAKEKAFSCRYCSETFKYSSSLELHERVHLKTPTIAFACLECPAQYGSEEALVIHQICHQPRADSWKCLTCQKFFPSVSQLKLHEHVDHGQGQGQMQQNQIHLHSNPPQPIQPSAVEVNRWQSGMSTTAIAPTVVKVNQNDAVTFHCQYCSKPYQHLTALAAHIRLHTGERPFACQHCPLKFRSKRNLRSHNEKRHTHLEQLPNTGEDEIEFVNYEGDDMVNFEEEETVGMITLPPENCIMLPSSGNLNNMKYEGEPEEDEVEMTMEMGNENQCEAETEAEFTLPLVPHVEMEIGNSQEAVELNQAMGVNVGSQPQPLQFPLPNFQDFVAPDFADGIPSFQDLISEGESESGQNELVVQPQPIPNLVDTTSTSTPTPMSSNGNDDFLLGL